MAAQFIIAVATMEDEAAVSALLLASYTTLMSAAYSPSVLMAMLPKITRASHYLLSSGTCYLAQGSDGRTLGCGGWTHNRPGSGGTEPGLAHIRHFAVHPDWLEYGIGKLIYTGCETMARLAGMDRFEFYSSLNAQGFYSTLGFSTAGRIDVAVGGGANFPAHAMRRSI